MNLNIVTWNILGCIWATKEYHPVKKRYCKILETLDKLQGDVVCLNEFVPDPEFIDALCRNYDIFYNVYDATLWNSWKITQPHDTTCRYDMGSGNAILVRQSKQAQPAKCDILMSVEIPLSQDGNMAIMIVTKKYCLVTFHLEPSSYSARVEQLNKLCTTLMKYDNLVILAGDFNSGQHSTLLQEYGFIKISPEGPTHPFLNDGTDTNIDQIYMRQHPDTNVKPEWRSHICFNKLNPIQTLETIGSDHYPVQCVLNL